MPILEPNIYGLWGAAQANGTTPVLTTAMTRRFVQVAGDFTSTRDDGSEAYGDIPVAGIPASSKYGNETDWVNSLEGAGEPGIEATPTELAWLLWLLHGSETVSSVATVTGPPLVPASQRHRFTPQTALGKPATFCARVGNQVVRRQKFNNCYVTRVQVEGSTANKAVRVTPRILSLDPAEVFVTDPTLPAAGLPSDRPFLYTDGTGAFTIDGTVFRGHSQFTLVIDDAWTTVYSDDTTAFDLVQGNPTVTIGVTTFADGVALAELNTLIYGSATPAAGTKPLKVIPALGSYAFDLRHRDSTGAFTGRRFVLTIPGVKWTAPPYPGPNPAGGPTELAFAGAMRPVAASQPYTIDVHTDNLVTAFTG
jgi:hypothetical protein